MIAARAKLAPNSIAIESKAGTLTYRQFDDRANRLAAHLAALGVARGKRVAILSENRAEYLEVHAAAAKLGAIVACQNWRLAPPELEHCINLVAPQVVVTSPRHVGLLDAVKHSAVATIVFGEAYEAALAGQRRVRHRLRCRSRRWAFHSVHQRHHRAAEGERSSAIGPNSRVRCCAATNSEFRSGSPRRPGCHFTICPAPMMRSERCSAAERSSCSTASIQPNWQS